MAPADYIPSSSFPEPITRDPAGARRTPSDQFHCGPLAGIALPVSLLGLVAISALVMAVILTATTESLLSVAQQDATAELYATEGAVQAYLAGVGAGLTPVEPHEFIPPGSEQPVTIRVAHLARFVATGEAAGTTWVYSIQAAPARGGRAVVALARVGTACDDAQCTRVVTDPTFGWAEIVR